MSTPCIKLCFVINCMVGFTENQRQLAVSHSIMLTIIPKCFHTHEKTAETAKRAPWRSDSGLFFLRRMLYGVTNDVGCATSALGRNIVWERILKNLKLQAANFTWWAPGTSILSCFTEEAQTVQLHQQTLQVHSSVVSLFRGHGFYLRSPSCFVTPVLLQSFCLYLSQLFSWTMRSCGTWSRCFRRLSLQN